MSGRLAGKAVIITGSTLGLGKAAALLFAAEGAMVVICDRGRTPENAKKVLRDAADLPGEVAYRVCDVMKRQDITALAAFALDRFGKVDVMMNNAIIDNPGGNLRDVKLEDWEAGIFCHMTAPLLFCQAVVPSMIEQGAGSIINVSSANALHGATSISSYGPAKAGMTNLTLNLAVALGQYGIRANTLTPARMLTEKKNEMLAGSPVQVRRQQSLYPMGSPALPEQVAQAALFLASDESAAVTGHNLVTDRGVGIQNPAAVQPRTEDDIRAALAAQGSEWIRGEQ